MYMYNVIICTICNILYIHTVCIYTYMYIYIHMCNTCIYTYICKMWKHAHYGISFSSCVVKWSNMQSYLSKSKLSILYACNTQMRLLYYFVNNKMFVNIFTQTFCLWTFWRFDTFWHQRKGGQMHSRIIWISNLLHHRERIHQSRQVKRNFFMISRYCGLCICTTKDAKHPAILNQ